MKTVSTRPTFAMFESTLGVVVGGEGLVDEDLTLMH